MLFLILFYKSIKPTISLFPPVDHLWMCHVCSFFLFYVPGQFLVFVMFFSQFLLPCHQLHPHRLCFSPHLPSLTNHLPSVSRFFHVQCQILTVIHAMDQVSYVYQVFTCQVIVSCQVLFY